MKLLVITGPTASGKTRLAVHLANVINGEIISADSRQVYRGMDIGTGKDLSDYRIQGTHIPYHLIDICEAGEEYNLFEYQKDFVKVLSDIISRNKFPVLAGGTGLYIEAVLKNFRQTSAPINEELRTSMETKEKIELEKHLNELNRQKLNFDVSTKKRLIRAIEISQFLEKNELEKTSGEALQGQIFCLRLPREVLLGRIKDRLKYRLENGMIEEVEGLIKRGVNKETLKYYGLEYKFITQYLEGDFPYEEMYEKLNVAIRQYAKRQMTWFRRMERHGFKINWINGQDNLNEQVNFVLKNMDELL